MVKRAAGVLLQSIEIDRDSRRPLGTQLYVGLRDLIVTGSIAGGERLPATRTLARDLCLSRTIVVEAFERLISEELIEARVGAGTFVSTLLHQERRHAPDIGRSPHDAVQLSRSLLLAAPNFAERARLPYAPRAFMTALPAFDHFPLAQWARLSAKHWRGARPDVMGYGEPCGLPHLRAAIASYLRASRGISCEAGQIFIVGGAQQAFHLIGSMLLDPGDRVWFEEPGAIGARNSLIASGAELVPVPVDENGMRVEEAMKRAPDFRLAFVTPSHQQPLGTVMSLERRIALLNAADAASAWIIEDDYDGEFFFGGRPPPTLTSIDTHGRVIYVGTFSKSLFPSLRLGFILAPERLAEALASAMSMFLPGVPSASQAIVAEFIDEGFFTTHIRRMRRLYAERHDTLCEQSRRHLAGMLDIVPTGGGLHTVGMLHPGLDERDVAMAAEARQISVSPIARFRIVPAQSRGLVLGFGGIRPSDIAAGIRVLAEVLGPRMPGGSPSTGPDSAT